MESTTEPVGEPKINYVIFAMVQKLEEKYDICFTPSTGKIEQGPSLGWFVQFEGSTESVYMSDTKPAWEVGDTVKITFERQL